MKNRIFILLLVLSFNCSRAQHYTQGFGFDSTIFTGHYQYLAGCSQNYDPVIKLDTSLFNYANGIKFMIVIDTLNFPYPCPIQAGDTIVLNAANPTFSLILISGLTFWFHIEIAGIPTTAAQVYPCHIEVDQCTCFCMNILIRKSTFNTSVCHVDLPNSIKKINSVNNLMIYPNPGNGKFTFSNINKDDKIEIFDISGKLINESVAKDVSAMVDIEGKEKGVYTYKITTLKGEIAQGKLILK